MVDWVRVRELRDEIGEENFPEVIELFLDEVEQVLAQLGSGANISRLAEDLHFLKGSSWNVGFQTFGALCAEGERIASEGRGGDVDLHAVLDAYAAAKAAFFAGLADQTGIHRAA